MAFSLICLTLSRVRSNSSPISFKVMALSLFIPKYISRTTRSLSDKVSRAPLTSSVIDSIIIFASGCFVGLLGFSRILAWLLKNYHNLTFGFISGMLLGSIYVLWPWQQAISFYMDSSGAQHPLQTVNIWPLNYTEITGNPSWVAISLISFVGGIAVVVLLHSIFDKKDAANV